jgi:hypothetical protein
LRCCFQDAGSRMPDIKTFDPSGVVCERWNAEANDMRCLRHRGLSAQGRLAGLIPQGSQLIGSGDENNCFRPLRGRMS